MIIHKKVIHHDFEYSRKIFIVSNDKEDFIEFKNWMNEIVEK